MTARRAIDAVFAVVALALAAYDANQAVVTHRSWFWVLAGVLVLFAGYYARRFFMESGTGTGR